MYNICVYNYIHTHGRAFIMDFTKLLKDCLVSHYDPLDSFTEFIDSLSHLINFLKDVDFLWKDLIDLLRDFIDCVSGFTGFRKDARVFLMEFLCDCM